MLNSIRDAVAQVLPHRRKTNATSGWISFNAPCCVHNGESADTRGRGGIVMNPDGGVSYHCFNCNFKASYVPGRHLTYKFRKLLSWLGADENTVKRLVIEAVRVKELIAPEQVVEAQEVEPVNFRPRPMPEQALTLEEWHTFYTVGSPDSEHVNVPASYADAVEYVCQRAVDTGYTFYWTPESQYNLNKRIIVPFTWQKKIIGYTARALDANIKPKYFNSHEPGYVFNVDRQQPDWKFVIVCEGPFDAMSVDGVATLGNQVSEQQADIIDSLGREVIVVPDTDRAGQGLIDAAVEYGWTVSFPVWMESCKDINDAVIKYGKLFVIKSILDAQQTSKLKIELHRKRIYN